LELLITWILSARRKGKNCEKKKERRGNKGKKERKKREENSNPGSLEP